MGISDNYLPVKILGNGVTTQFSASWNVINADYIRVFLEDKDTGVQTLQTINTNFTLMFDESGLTVTFLVAPSNQNYVVIARSVSIDQGVPYKTSQGFQGAVQENSFDKLTAIAQDIQDQIDRTLKFSIGSSLSGSYPAPVVGALLSWADLNGNIQNILPTDLDVLAGNSSIVSPANNDFLIYNSSIGYWVNRTLVQTQTILGLGSAAYTNSSAYATAAQGAKADTAIQPATKLTTKTYYTVGGPYTFNVPVGINKVFVRASGPGGGGASETNGSAATNTTVTDGTTLITAGGGAGGIAAFSPDTAAPADGVATNGDLNIPNGGGHGGNGIAANSGSIYDRGGHGGNGGYVEKTYSGLTGGTSTLTINVGAAGVGSSSPVAARNGAASWVCVEY